MSLVSHKTILWGLPIKYFWKSGHPRSGPHGKFLFFIESMLIYILVTFVLEKCCISKRSVAFLNVDLCVQI